MDDQDDGITAYHGSPHDFDQFDLSKIGTGEGAQAYGHGLYFAENEDVARDYRNRVSRYKNIVSWHDKTSGKRVEVPDLISNEIEDFMRANGSDLRSGDFDHKSANYRRWAKDRIEKQIPEYEDALRNAKPEHVEWLTQSLNDLHGDVERYQAAADFLDKHRPRPIGRMYEVRIKAHPDHFLDWDKPMSEQSDYVKDAFIRAQVGDDPELKDLIDLSPESMMYQGMVPTAKGSAAYKTLVENHGSQEAATRKLYKAGIKGIRYLDAGSRSDKEGSRNYVVFDDKLVNVRKKYEQGGSVPGYAEGGGVNQQAGVDFGEGPNALSYRFNVNDLISHAETKDNNDNDLYPVMSVNPNIFKEQLAWRQGETKESDEERTSKADIKYPLIATTNPFDGSLHILDGTHRAQKAIRSNLNSVPVRVIPHEHLEKFRVKNVDDVPYHQTPEFRNWFGDSVAHQDGVPITYYHGTSKDKDFPSFNVGRHGVWLTTHPGEASEYAAQNDSQNFKYEDGRYRRTNTASRVIPVHIKAENPYTGSRPDFGDAENYKKLQSDWFDTLRAQGYDSWIPAAYKGGIAVILKAPTQIKSIYNRTFDPKNKRMDKEAGGSAVSTLRRMSNPAVSEAVRVIMKSGSSPRDAVTLSKRLLGRQ